MSLKSKSNEMDMLHGPLAGNILLFSLPLALTGILQQLFNAADVAVVGQFVGTNAMAAVGANSPLIGLLVNLFVGMSLGSNVVIAMYIGQERRDAISRAVHTSLLFTFVTGAAIAVAGEFAAGPVLEAMDVPEDVMGMAEAYLRIYLAGMPVILLYNFEAAIFRSVGDTKTPLIALLISGIINVILNLFFVLVVGMDVDGVALATVISNVISSMYLLYRLAKSDTELHFSWHDLRIDKKELGKILRIGLPSGIQGALFAVANIIIQVAVNTLGATYMAASSAALNIEIFSYDVLNSFGQACTTFVGQNVGAGNKKRCRQVLRTSLIEDYIFTAAICGAILLTGHQLLAVFNGNEDVIHYGYMRLCYIFFGYIFSVLVEVFSGYLRGFGMSLAPAAVTVAGICGVRIVWVYTVFAANPAFSTLMFCYPLSLAVNALLILLCLLVKRPGRELPEKESAETA